MSIGLYVILAIFALIWMAAKIHELRYQLRQALHERDVFARSLAMRFSPTDGYGLEDQP